MEFGLGLGEGFGYGRGLGLGFGGDLGADLGFDLFAADAELFEEAGGERVFAGVVGAGKLAGGGQVAVGGVGDDLFDDVAFRFAASLCGFVGREVEGGDLEAVEKEAGAARVDAVGGDAAEDLAEGELDGAAVFGQGRSKVDWRPRRARGSATGLREAWWK